MASSEPAKLKRVLIANRGEIALRVLRACRDEGIEAVCVYSEADADATYVKLADRAVCIGRPVATDSYLNVPRLIAAAEIAEADAIHPGYGFLSENAGFAEIVAESGFKFIGPSHEAMRRVGDKVNCKALARKAKVPIVPGSKGEIEDEDEAVKVADEIGYPVIVKASAGGGGRGMRVARNEHALRQAVGSARQEAEAAFKNGTVYLEKFIEAGKHVEVQVIADEHGNACHLYERDCSVQRRHQKLIEEAPSPSLDDRQRKSLCESAVRLIKEAGYTNAGTVEYLLDKDGSFYLLEVNARIQVEHPVSEQITGVDLIREQLRVAAGEPLSFRQKDLSINGHAIECRLNAEDPDRNFMPQPGTVETWIPPGGPGVRLDTHVHAGYRIPPNYDSMVGKLIVHRRTRDEAIAASLRALGEFRIAPMNTTIPLQARILDSTPFRKATVDTKWLEGWLEGAGKR